MTRILCYDIRYPEGKTGPAEVEVLVNLPSNWHFEFVPARDTVRTVLESKVGKVFRFDWRPL